MEAKIQMIQPSGATEMFQGLELGAKEVMRSLDSKRVNHIILLTDGHTYGDEQQCLDLASKLAERGIGISGMGIGQGMERCFSGCAFNTHWRKQQPSLPSPRTSNGFCLRNSMRSPRPIAEDITLEVSPVEGVDLAYAFRLQPDPSPIALDEARCILAQYCKMLPLSVLFEYIIQPEAVKSEFGDDSGWYAESLDRFAAVSCACRCSIRLKRPVSDSPEAEPPPPEDCSSFVASDVVSYAGTGT